MPYVSIIIVNYNGGLLVERCLRSVLKTNFFPFDVLVVDNASSDGSPDLIAKHFPSVRLIRLLGNLGYAGANNVGIRAATGKYLVLLNSDTEVEPEWLTHLVEVAERRPDAAFLQPKILFLDKHAMINSAGNAIHFAGFGLCRGISSRDEGQYDRIEEVGYASGACVMVSRVALQKVGPLDEIFFAYGEDKDWGWRARMLGYKSIYVPAARIYHKWSAVLGRSPRKMYYLELERLISICKNHPERLLVLLMPILVLVEIAALIHAAAGGWLAEKIMAYAHTFGLRSHIARRRRQLSHNRRIADKRLIESFTFELLHPYVGKLAIPLNFLCLLYRRLLLVG